MQNRSYLFLLLVVVLGALAGVLFSATTPKYGLDVSGGIRLTYQFDLTQLTPDQRKNIGEIGSQLVDIIEIRVHGMGGASEGTVQLKGTDQLIVEIPNATDIDAALKIIGNSAKMQMFHAKTLNTKGHTNRLYEDVASEDPNNPTVYFRDLATGKIIKPVDDKGKTDPQYEKVIKSWGDPILEGTDLRHAGSRPEGNSFVPTMDFTADGARKIGAWCDKYYNSGEKLAYVLDNRVLNVAPIADGARISDQAYIQGTFSPEYVTSLATLLNAGALPVTIKNTGYQTVDPTIGKQALSQIAVAGGIAFSVVAIFLIAYYAFPGIVAAIALSLYVLFTLSILKAIGATFSLAGIAGFILSVGMAVDANILVFERFKEEMKRGRTLHSAIELGFKRALPAIVDSNACTLLTSFVLVGLGTGPVKGFATTLIVGVLISLFTAVFVTRSLLVFFVDSGFAANPKWYAVERNWFKKLEEKADTEPLQVVEKAKKWFLISAATIVVFFFFITGFKLNVEFQGGFEAVYSVAGNVQSNTTYAANLERNGLKGGNVKFAFDQKLNEHLVYITLPPNKAISEITASADGIPASANRSKFVADKAGLTGVTDRGFTEIGPVIQAETVKNAIIAVIMSSAFIIIYLAFRFGFSLGGFIPGLRFGGSAIIALLHDILVVVGSAGLVGQLLGWEISSLFITAMLTVIGFSVHDTIVIFDRIRENLRRPDKGHDLGFAMDRSITQSFARSLNTSMTVVVTLAILIAFGTATPDLKFFCVAMLVGIVSGTYSSIYNASPILYLWDKAICKKNPKNGLVALALEEQAKARVMQTTVRTAAAPQVENQQTGRSYGQVRRRASSQPKGHVDIDDEP